MNKTRIHTPLAPAALGPYSQAIVANGMVYCSGQIPLDAQGVLSTGDVQAQTHQVLRNLEAVLKAAGSSLDHVVQTTCYLASMEDFPQFNEVYALYFAEPFPARATVEVSQLPKQVLVEVSCIALAR